MVSRFFRFLNRDIVSMNQAALVLAVFSILSQLFGLVRDRLLASLVGPSAHLDVYYAAFRIPDFVYNSFGIVFSVTVLIPFITECLQKDQGNGSPTALRAFLNNVFTVYVYGMGALLVALFFLMPWLTHLTAPGFNAAQHDQLVLFSRIMLLSPFLFGLSSLLSSFAQVQKKFFSFAIAPLFYNLGILLGIVAFWPRLGIFGVVLGVVIGAVLYFGIQLPTLAALHKLPRLVRHIDWAQIKRVVVTSIPRTIGSSLSNLTFIIMAAIASLLAAGSISIFQFAYNIENTPLLVFGVSYAVAAFPTMAKHFLSGERAELFSVLYRATRNIFFLTMPVALIMIVLRAHIVRILLGAGQFSWNDTRLVAAGVALFCISVTAQSMVLLMVRAFFAVGNTKTPLRINVWTVVATAISATALVTLYHKVPFAQDFINDLLRIDGTTGGSVVMLALAYSIGQIGNAIALWRAFHHHMEKPKRESAALNRTLSHMIAAAIIAATASYGALAVIGANVDQTHFFGIFVQAAIATITGLVTYSIILIALGNEDIMDFIHTLRSKFWKQKPLVPQQQDL
jgi:putative peptidoglycan lipid II flippase